MSDPEKTSELENKKRREGRDWTSFRAFFAEKMWPKLEKAVLGYMGRTRWWYIKHIESDTLNFKEVAIMWVLSSSRETSFVPPSNPGDREIWVYEDLFRARIILYPDLAGEYFKYIYENIEELFNKHWPNGKLLSPADDMQTESSLIPSLIPPHQERGLFKDIFANSTQRALLKMEERDGTNE